MTSPDLAGEQHEDAQFLLHPDRCHNCLKNLTPSCYSRDRSFPIVKRVVPVGTVESRRVLTHELLAIIQAGKRISWGWVS